jgi:hypothetical protein
MAFLILNRYIDFADAIEDGTGEIMDNAYFSETDIPVDINLPEVKFLSVIQLFSSDKFTSEGFGFN